MFSKLLFSALIAGVAFVRADPNPSEPGPGDIFNEGATCHIAWDPDTTGVWKVMNIELMSGSNLQMNHITSELTSLISIILHFFSLRLWKLNIRFPFHSCRDC